MPAEEVGAAYVAIRAVATNFREQATAEVNSALASVRERATVPIRATVDTTAANRVQQSFQPVVAGARQMGSEVEKSYNTVGSSSHSAYERVQLSHDGIRARFGETLRAASAMGGGIALAYGVFSQVRSALQATNELAHSTNILTQATGLSARQASAWISIAKSQGISAAQLQTGFNGLSRATISAQDAFAKAGVSAQQNLGRIHAEQIRVTSDTLAYRAALDKYGQGSTQAASAAATLSSAQNTLKGYVDKTTGSVTGAAGAFDKLGISGAQLKAVQGDLPAELDLIANKFQAMGAGTDRATIAQQLFGRGSSVLIPILAQGAAGIQKNIDVATQYGATLSGPTLKSMEQLRVEQQQLSLEMTGLRVRIATTLEPILISVGLVAIRVASQFGTILAGGVNIAKRAMDAFLTSPYGQELGTIAGDAIRFADEVRKHFQQTLERPLSFAHLFDSFKNDLINWLPGAAKDFWTQLNSDLFAPGKLVTIPIKARLSVQQEHGAQVPTTQLTGAGLFPGSSFTQQAVNTGKLVAQGVLNGLRDIISSGPTIGGYLTRALVIGVQFVADHASAIARGALIIGNAFVQVLTSPQFWVQNWNLILNLAIALFPYDRLAVIPKSILEALGLKEAAQALFTRMFGPAIDAVRLFPTAVGLAISRGGDVLQRSITEMFAFAATDATKIAGRVITVMGDIGGRIAGGLVRAIGEVFGVGIPRVLNAAFNDLTGTIDKAQAKLFDDVIGGFESNLLGKMFTRLVRFTTSSVVTGEIEQAGLDLYNDFWKPFSKALGPVSGFISTIASLKGILVGIGVVIGLAFGPVLAMWTASLALQIANTTASIIWTAATNAWTIATTAARVATFLWSGAVAVLNVVMDANPIVLVTLALIAIGVAFYEAYQHSATFRAVVQDVFGFLKTVGVSVLHDVAGVVTWFVDTTLRLWREYGPEVEAPFRTAFNFLSNIVSSFLDYIRSWINLIGDLIHGRWGNLWNDLVNLVKAALNFLVSWTGNRASDLFHAVWDPISNLPHKIAGVWSSIEGDIGSAWGSIVSTLKGWVDKLLSPVNSVLGFLHLSKIPTFGGGGVASVDTHAARIKNMATGGVVPGPRVNRDIVPAMLTPGEMVLNQGQQNMLGGGQFLASLFGFGAPHRGAFAGGGIGGGAATGQGGSPQSGNLLGDIAGAVGGTLGMLTDPIGWLKSHLPSLPSVDGVAGDLLQGLASYVKDKVLGWVSSHIPTFGIGGGGGPGITPHGTAATGANQALGLQLMLAAGFPASQWGALQALWTRESGWNQFALNASSGAYGIPQSLPASKMASAGADYLTNPATQIRWGLDYIRARYGSPGGAWAHEESAGWYHNGGVVTGPPGANVPIVAQTGEVVFRADQLAALKGMGGVTIHQLTIVGNSGPELADDFLNEIANRTRA